MDEKLTLLGLYLYEKGTFRSTKWLDEPLDVERYLHERKLKLSYLKDLAEKELERAKKLGLEILFIKDKAFPLELREIPYPPLFLYIKGHLSTSKNLAIVGSRKPTSYGKEVATLFARELSQAGLCLVSGLARGIDTIVHTLCVKQGEATIAVLGSGLDIVYPPENKKLFEEIPQKGGAVISEFPLGTKPKRENFPRRNRLISGLSSGVIIIEAGVHSGTLITAKWAQEQGKEVFAVPGNIFSEQSRGTHLLIKEGAIPVTHPKEVLEYLGVSLSTSSTKSSEDRIMLSPEEEKILSVLSTYPTPMEEILLRTGLPLNQLLSLLTDLELRNLIISLPGKLYQLNPSYQLHLKP